MFDLISLRDAFVELLPHTTCYLGNPWLTTGIGVSDFVIGTSYWFIGWGLFSIGLELRRVEAWPVVVGAIRAWMPLAFGCFILLCGIGHYVDVLTIYRGLYWVTALARLLTAIASASTAIALVRVQRDVRKEVGHTSVFAWLCAYLCLGGTRGE